MTQLKVNLQKDSIANQREHLILLLANVHIRQFPKPDQQPKVCLDLHRSATLQFIALTWQVINNQSFVLI